jgi:tricorn protease
MTPAKGYLRHPSIGGGQVVFVAEDDLWLVPAAGGHAFRLTTTAGAVSHPRLSPDGRQVAFTSTHDGPSEIYVMPTEGGVARRLTYQAARCLALGWAPSGEILYASTAEQPPGFGTRIFTVSADGGWSGLLPYGPASAIAHGPGDRLVLGRNTNDPARRKRYRGGTAGELWIGATAEGAVFRRLIQLPGNLASPCWAGDRVYFISDHDGIGNVYSCLPDGSELARHTSHRDYYARQLSSDGERLVYQSGAQIYRIDPGAGPEQLTVTLRTSRAQHDRRIVPAGTYLEDVALNHDGTTVAAAIRGKLFTFRNWEGPVRQHGAPDTVRYRLPSWLAGQGGVVASASDDRAEEYLVVVTPEAEAPSAAREIPFGGGRPIELVASPVADLVAVATHRHQLHLVAVGHPPGDTGPADRLIDRSPYDRIEDLAWSPDGRWLAYTWPASPHSSVVKIADTRTGAVHQVTEPALRDFAPCFDPEGRFLYFLGSQADTPIPDSLTAGLVIPPTVRPYVIALQDGQAAPFAPRPWRPDGENTDVAENGRVISPPIDFAGIRGRITPLPVGADDYRRVLASAGKIFLLVFPPASWDDDPEPTPQEEDDSQPAGLVHSFDLKTREITELVDGVTDMWLNQRRDVLLCESGRRLRILSAKPKPDQGQDLAAAPDEPGPVSGWIDLDRVRVVIRPQAEWRQMFREAWRLQREHFWDPGMTGIDWDEVYQRYLPLADLVASRAELSDLLWEVQGELGTSHAYEIGGEYRPGAGYRQGFLGVDWGEAGSGASIVKILSGDPRDPRGTSPCGRLAVDVRPGDVVVAVNGQAVGPAGPGELLIDQAGRDVELTVARSGPEGRPPSLHRVTVRPLADDGPARYRDWVTGNRRYVHETTGGRVGYVHVPNMYSPGYAEFIRSFLAEYDREALIVDVRFNGGGFCSWLVLERLARRRFGYESGRWNGLLPYPAEAPRGPMVALINEHTGSDSEVFSHVFRELRLGPLVGRRTWGGVIAMYPRHVLVDGTVTTQPEFCHAFDGVGRRLENRGVEPDIDVDIAPHDHVLGLDTQLTRAVETALREAERSPDPLVQAALMAGE